MLLNGNCSWSYKSLNAVKSCKRDSEELDRQSVLHIQQTETSISFLGKNRPSKKDEISFEGSTIIKKETGTCHLNSGFCNTASNSYNKGLQNHQYDFEETEQSTAKKKAKKKPKKVINKTTQNKCETPKRTTRALRNKKIVNYADIDSEPDSHMCSVKMVVRDDLSYKNDDSQETDEEEGFMCDMNDSDNSDEELVFQTRFSDKNANAIDIANSIESNSFENDEEEGTKTGDKTTISPIILRFDKNVKTEDQQISFDNSLSIEDENSPSTSLKTSQNNHAGKNLTNLNESSSVSSINEDEKELLNRNKSVPRTSCAETKHDDDTFNLKSELDENSFESNSPKGLFGIETFEESIVENNSESNGLENISEFPEQIEEIKVRASVNDHGSRYKKNNSKPKNLNSKKIVIKKDFVEKSSEVHKFSNKKELSVDKISPSNQSSSASSNKHFDKKQTQPSKVNNFTRYDSKETPFDTIDFKDQIPATKINFQSNNESYWDDYSHKNTLNKASIENWNAPDDSRPESEIDLDFSTSKSTVKEEDTGPLKKKSNRKTAQKHTATSSDSVRKRAPLARVRSNVSCESDASNRTVHLDSEGNIQSEKTPQSTRNTKGKNTTLKSKLIDFDSGDSFNLKNKCSLSTQSLNQQDHSTGSGGMARKRKMEEKFINKRKKGNHEEEISELTFLKQINCATSFASNKKPNAISNSGTIAIPPSKKPKTWEDLESNLLNEMDNNVDTMSAELNQIEAVSMPSETYDIYSVAEDTPKRKNSIWKKESSFKSNNNKISLVESNNKKFSLTESNRSHKLSPSKHELLLLDDVYRKKDDIAYTASSQNSATSSPSLNIVNKAISAMSKCTEEYLSSYNGNFKTNWMKYHNVEATNTEYGFSVQSTIIHASRKKLSMTEKTSKYFHNVYEEMGSSSKSNNSDRHLEKENDMCLDSSFKFSDETLNYQEESPDLNPSSIKSYSLRKRKSKANSTTTDVAKIKSDVFDESQKEKQHNASKYKTKQPKKSGTNKTDDSKLVLKNKESGSLTACRYRNNRFPSNASNATQKEQELCEDALNSDIDKIWEKVTTNGTQPSYQSPYDKSTRLKTIKNTSKIREPSFTSKEDNCSEENKIEKIKRGNKAINSKEKLETKDEIKETAKDKYIKYLKNLFQNDGLVEENLQGKSQKESTQNSEQELESNNQSSEIKLTIKDDDLFSISSEDSDKNENKCKEVPSQSGDLFFETLEEME